MKVIVSLLMAGVVVGCAAPGQECMYAEPQGTTAPSASSIPTAPPGAEPPTTGTGAGTGVGGATNSSGAGAAGDK